MMGNRSVLNLVICIIFYVLITLNVLSLTSALSASIKFEVEGEGFHRIMKYHVDTGNFKNKSCHIAIFISLPPTIYVNIDELADLRRLNKSFSCSDGEIDIELFAEKAYYQNVTICSQLNNSKTTLSVPVHQRYQFATSTGEPFSVSLPRPKLLIGCKDRLKEHRVSKHKLCWPCIEYSKKWRDISYKWESDGNFVWNIPVGNTSDKFKVTCITLFTTLAAAIYVLWTIYKTCKVPKDRWSKDN